MADTKISALATASALTGAEKLLLSQAGSDKQIDLATARQNLYWSRPADWLAMPSDAANKISILAAVWDNGSNYCALNVTLSSGTYSVDWGDGVTDTGIASGANATHQYSYSDGDLAGSESTRGYKQAMVVITTSGGNITAFSLATAATPAGNPWLDVLANVPSCTSLNFSLCNVLERVRLTAISSSITTLASIFAGDVNLQRVDFPAAFAGNVTTIASMFDACRALRRIDFRGWGFDSSLVTATTLFRNCNALFELLYDAGMFDSITSASDMFNQCSSITTLTLNLPACTNLSFGFSGMRSLQRLVFTALGAVTNIASMVQDCSILRELVFPSGFGGSVSSASNAFASCSQLSRIVNCGIATSFSVASCKLSATALDEIYTALPTDTDTITVTSNFGTSGDTPSIATGKGWTVTGS